MNFARTAALAALLLAWPGSADTVLLDEVWSPEIMVNDVVATEIDTVQTGDPSMARSGEFSIKLENLTGFPNVRFRSATVVRRSGNSGSSSGSKATRLRR
ncbi:MAG: hypothetical protein HYU66_17055 [Armatimonadetes bacterium]|nr:hypothetical protein [Armatimonadota bacterium]